MMVEKERRQSSRLLKLQSDQPSLLDLAPLGA